MAVAMDNLTDSASNPSTPSMVNLLRSTEAWEAGPGSLLVLALVCWEAYSSPTLLTTPLIMITVMVSVMVVIMATSNLLGIYV